MHARPDQRTSVPLRFYSSSWYACEGPDHEFVALVRSCSHVAYAGAEQEAALHQRSRIAFSARKRGVRLWKVILAYASAVGIQAPAVPSLALGSSVLKDMFFFGEHDTMRCRFKRAGRVRLL